MVSYIASYLFDRRTHLNHLWTRRTGTTEEFWTRDSVSGLRFGGVKPVSVLTSSRTFLGGEEFAYDLQQLQRAAIIGETTGGGAHPMSSHRIDDQFLIAVPFARAVTTSSRCLLLTVYEPVLSGISKRLYRRICDDVCPWNVSFAVDRIPTDSVRASSSPAASRKQAKSWTREKNARVVVGDGAFGLNQEFARHASFPTSRNAPLPHHIMLAPTDHAVFHLCSRVAIEREREEQTCRIQAESCVGREQRHSLRRLQSPAQEIDGQRGEGFKRPKCDRWDA